MPILPYRSPYSSCDLQEIWVTTSLEYCSIGEVGARGITTCLNDTTAELPHPLLPSFHAATLWLSL